MDGSVPGADDNGVDREDPFERSVPGADDDPVDREGLRGGSLHGAADDPFEGSDPAGERDASFP